MKKFLSLILALTLVASLFTINVMAASTARTATISTDATGALSAGDEVTVSIALATTANINNVEYILCYDKDVFEIDTTKGWAIGRSNYENFLDQEWYTAVMTDEYNNWYYYFGGPTVTYAVDGEIYCTFADLKNGTGYIEENFAVENDVVGKFILKVKDGATAGSYEFTLKNASTMDNGEQVPVAMSVNTATVTVAAPAVTNPVAGDATAADSVTAGEVVYDNAIKVSASITVGNADEIGFLFIPKVVADEDGNWDKAAKATLTGDAMGDGTWTVNAALIKIPRRFGDITILSKAYAKAGENYTYGGEVSKTLSF